MRQKKRQEKPGRHKKDRKRQKETEEDSHKDIR